MCTVSFVKANGKIIITSNRDEKIIRPNAIEPKTYQLNNKNVIFPKDNKAGGTWYAIDEHSNVLVLLNGAEEKHILKESYRKSRGLIVLDLIGCESPLEAWKTIDLKISNRLLWSYSKIKICINCAGMNRRKAL